MADGLNQIRAHRVTEIITDFHNIQTYLASIRANPAAEEYNEEGYVLLRKCIAEAQSLLSQPFHAQNGSSRDEEQNRQQLRRIIVDACIRRFKAQKIMLRANAALRWINSRAAILQGQRPHAGHAGALQQIRNTLRSEVSAITDQRVDMSLRTVDNSKGYWVQEDPSFQIIQRMAGCSR